MGNIPNEIEEHFKVRQIISGCRSRFFVIFSVMNANYFYFRNVVRGLMRRVVVFVRNDIRVKVVYLRVSNYFSATYLYYRCN